MTQGPVGTERETPKSSLVARQGALPGEGEAWVGSWPVRRGGGAFLQRAQGVIRYLGQCDRSRLERRAHPHVLGLGKSFSRTPEVLLAKDTVQARV